ncbi:MAG: site-specific DNA-methyltransferase [Chloroflexaceae bacterium]|nr:site-specific DNA-methyltransferase [Chloroflexaceae bacterium]
MIHLKERKRPVSLALQHSTLKAIEYLDRELAHHFHERFKVQPSLTRSMVSFQANKERPRYRWYKYKEAFSAPLVEYLLSAYHISSGKLLDPFAGSGTALFAARAWGLDAEGIELLPIGQYVVSARIGLEQDCTVNDLQTIRHWADHRPWEHSEQRYPLPKLRITDGAYPPQTSEAIERYLGTLQMENESVQKVLRFALLCVLETVSYTRKDGQYLRWDDRARRRQGTRPFNKGHIPDLASTVGQKLHDIVADLQNIPMSLFAPVAPGKTVHLYEGSCLDVMPTLPTQAYDVIMTSPPYCNRYDYTRTYALELALLGMDEPGLVDLRQRMMSCTVEHRPKDLMGLNPSWSHALAAADQQDLLQAILHYLEQQKEARNLNNQGIPRMVRGYFYEMTCIIAECFRVLKPHSYLFLINDNVRYAGASISVDMILSHIAEQVGFQVKNILVLPNGKGNSSQQMGRHGRDALRKCVYVWKKE